MKLVWGNSFDNSYNYIKHEKKQLEKGIAGNMANGAVFGNNKLAKQKMEEKLRQAEDKLLEEYRSQIATIQSSNTDDDKTKKIKISIVNEQIKQIEDARAKRELDAMTEELEKQKIEAEKQKKSAEKKKAEQTEDDIENGITREDIEGMVKLTVSNESIREMKRTKAMLNSEAKQLEIDISNDFGITKYGRISTSHASPNDFRHRQLKKLNIGMGRLESSIASEVREMAKSTADIAKEKALFKEPVRNNEEDLEEEKTQAEEQVSMG